MTTRLEHLAGLPFTTFVVVAVPAALVAGALVRGLVTERAREWLLVAVSLAVIALLCGPSVTAIGVAYALGLRVVVETMPARAAKTLAAAAFSAAFVAAPVWFIAELGTAGRQVREFTAFATNVGVLRFWAWAWDRRQGGAPESVSRYLLAMLFFPTFVNGPIEAPRSFAGAWRAPDAADLRAGVARVAAGVAKLLVVGLALEPGWTRVLEGAPGAPAWRLWAWGALLYGWFYLSFAAWSDVAIGIGRLLGRRVQENFDRPWMAQDPGDFWRRWHVSLGLWLRDYVYIPLGGNRRHRALNVLAVFGVSAVWHVWGTLKLLGFGYFPVQAWGGFLLWGLLHAAGVVLLAGRGAAATSPAARTATRFATTAFAAWAWVPFFIPASVSFGQTVRVLARMLVPVG
jgi:hypothetical protein